MRDFLLRVAYLGVAVYVAGVTFHPLPPWLFALVLFGFTLWTVREIAPREPEPPSIADFSCGPRVYPRRDMLLLHYEGLDPRVAAGLQEIRCAELAHEVDRVAMNGDRWTDEPLIALEHVAGVALRDCIELQRRAMEFERELDA